MSFKDRKLDVCCDSENIAVFASECDQQIYESDFEYTSANVAGPGLMGTDPQELQYCGCSCNVPSCGESCLCIQRFGPNYTPGGKLLHSEDHKQSGSVCRISKPVFECNASCSCGENCGNRLVQNGIRHQMEVFKTDDKGWGLRTLETIEENMFVCEYAGEVVTREEARLRTSLMQAGDMNYIFVLKERIEGNKTTETFIDAKRKGSIARFINHSCEPNLYLLAVRVHNEIPKVAMFARRDIASGEELSYHYSGDVTGCDEEKSVLWDDDMNSLTKCQPRKLCMCNSPSCQKYLPYDTSIYPTNN